MAIVTKKINGHDYKYEATWDKQEKRNKWVYLGPVKSKIFENSNRTVERSDKEVFDHLYNKLKRDPIMGLTKKQLNRIRHHIKQIKRNK